MLSLSWLPFMEFYVVRSVRGDRPPCISNVTYSLWHSPSSWTIVSRPSRLVVISIPRVRLSPRRGISCSSLSSSGFIVLVFYPHRDSSCSPHFIVIPGVRLSELVASRETRDASRVHCGFFFRVPCSYDPGDSCSCAWPLVTEELPYAMLPWAKC